MPLVRRTQVPCGRSPRSRVSSRAHAMAAARSRLHKMIDGSTEPGSRVPAVEYVSILRGARGLRTGTGYGVRITGAYGMLQSNTWCGRRGVVKVAYKYRQRWRGTTEVQMRV